MAYYVICDDDCRYESMTKEQIIAAIAEATGSTPTSIDDAFISKIKEINANETARLWIGTETQFNALSPTPEIGKSVVRIGTDGVMYICTDDTTLNGVPSHAETHHKGGTDEITPDSIKAAALNDGGKVNAEQTSAAINTQTGSYSLALSDAGKLVIANATEAATITIPANSTVAFPIGTEIEITQYGAGAVTIAAASGVTINSMDGLISLAGQYATVCVKKIFENTWLLVGALA